MCSFMLTAGTQRQDGSDTTGEINNRKWVTLTDNSTTTANTEEEMQTSLSVLTILRYTKWREAGWFNWLQNCWHLPFLNQAPGVIHKGVDCRRKKTAIFTAQRECRVFVKKNENSLKGMFKKKRFGVERSNTWCQKERSRCWLQGTRTQPVSTGQRWTLIDMFLLAWIMFLLGSDRQTAPMRTGAIQGNCVKVTSLRKI